MSEIKSIFYETIKELKGYAGKILILAVLLYLLSGIYTVKQDETAIVKRFGKIINSNVKPGISYSLPWPIDSVKKIKIKSMQTIKIDNFSEFPDKNSQTYKFMKTTELKPYVITGDNNIVNLEITIKYLIVNPVNYENNFKNPKKLIYETANNTIIKYVSQKSINDILINKRSEMRFTLKRNIQKKLNQLDMGVKLTFLELKKITPPSLILHFFNDVINANIDREKAIREAYGYKTNVLTKARIKSKEILKKAQAQAKEILNNSKAEEKRYADLFKEYKKSPKQFYKTQYLNFISDAYQYFEKTLITPANGKKIRYSIFKQ